MLRCVFDRVALTSVLRQSIQGGKHVVASLGDHRPDLLDELHGKPSDQILRLELGFRLYPRQLVPGALQDLLGVSASFRDDIVRIFLRLGDNRFGLYGNLSLGLVDQLSGLFSSALS